jgi:hypothetical protein
VDGHLYGRGTSDNKGPILAFIYAVKVSSSGLIIRQAAGLKRRGHAKAAKSHTCGACIVIVIAGDAGLLAGRWQLSTGQRGIHV